MGGVMTLRKILLSFTIAVSLLTTTAVAVAADTTSPSTLLNVSYDPTREFYDQYNKLFVAHWKEQTGQDVKITQSHGGSGTQARSVIEGLNADVVTLALAYDIDKIAARGLIATDWQARLPHDSCPYSSAIVFLVHKGNPKHIKDWDDLVRDDVQVLTPNPKSSGGARWNYLAAWGYAYKKNNGSEDAAKEYVKKLYAHVPVLDTGARGATINYTKRGLGDVLITWESEALLIIRELDKGQFEIVTPSVSVLAEPSVAVVDKNTEKNGSQKLAQEYLFYLYSKPAQELIAKFYYRPSDSAVAAEYASTFPALTLLNIKEFGGWTKVQEKHFAEGGIFDQIYGK